MSFDRERQPEPVGYFESLGLRLKGPGKWKTTACTFHGGSDSMRINVASGTWVCMSCGVSGGDVLSYHMQAHHLEFVEAAKSLGCWVEVGKPQGPQKPTPLPPRAALQVIGFEATLAAVAAANVAHGKPLSEPDRFRLLAAAARINRLVEAYA
jgi:hypothetical protein